MIVQGRQTYDRGRILGIDHLSVLAMMVSSLIKSVKLAIIYPC